MTIHLTGIITGEMPQIILNHENFKFPTSGR